MSRLVLHAGEHPKEKLLGRGRTGDEGGSRAAVLTAIAWSDEGRCEQGRASGGGVLRSLKSRQRAAVLLYRPTATPSAP